MAQKYDPPPVHASPTRLQMAAWVNRTRRALLGLLILAHPSRAWALGDCDERREALKITVRLASCEASDGSLECSEWDSETDFFMADDGMYLFLQDGGVLFVDRLGSGG